MRSNRRFHQSGTVWREQPRRRLRWPLLGASVIALGVLVYKGGIPVGSTPSVELASVQQKTMPTYVEGEGRVQADKTVTVHAQAAGMLSEVLFREGQDVKKGDVLARIDPRSYQVKYDQALADKTQDEALLAQRRLGKRIKLPDGQENLFTVGQLEAAVKADQATIDQLAEKLARTTITAPISGRAGMRLVDAGNHVKEGDDLVVVTQMQPVTVTFRVPQEQLAFVNEEIAHDRKPQVKAVSSGEERPLGDGVIAVAENQVDGNNSVGLKAEFSNEKRMLWPGAQVKIRLLTGERENALVVPADAVRGRGKKAHVYVYDAKKGKADRRAVTYIAGDRHEAIIEGVTKGEQVVADSVHLRDGAKVTVAGQR